MITSLSIENFKSFSKSQKLNLSPITLIYGPNSSGKSTIIQSLMMLKQTVLAKSANGSVITNGDTINLGSFDSLVHGQKADSNVHIELEYKNNWIAEEFRHKYSYDMLFSNKEKRAINFTFGKLSANPIIKDYKFISNRENNDSVALHFSRNERIVDKTFFTLKNSDDNLRSALARRFKIKKEEGYRYFELDNALSSSTYINNSQSNLPVAEFTTAFSEFQEYLSKANDDVEELFQSFRYLGPLRSSPKRYYSIEVSQYQKGQGKSNLGLELFKANPIVKSKINKYLHQFNIPYELDFKNIGDLNTGDVVTILLKDLRNDAIITPSDVGFGIGQVLPIILDSITSQNKTICVEQPEIHLHPKLQAHLADLFIDSCKSGNQWIVETHSEALMLRIQRRIREGKLSKNDVSVLYVDSGENGAVVTPIHLDDEGDFTVHWPDGFFEERLDEM